LTTDSEAQPRADEVGRNEPPEDMATLLEQGLDFRAPQRGEIVEGVVMGWDRDGALVDIGAKSEGVVLRHEMQSLGPDPESRLQSGDKVLVFIVHPETPEGQVMLSIDRARGEQGWRILQDRFEASESFEGTVSGYNKGGLLVNVEGVNAFVPLSQVMGVRPDRDRDDASGGLAEVVGRNLRLKVIEINRRRNRVILSERAALQEWRMEQKERLIQELHEGDIRKGRISSVRSFGIFVDLGGADGLAHLSELTWERDKTPSELFKVGDEVDVYVTKVDAENKKIALSIRRANPGVWDAIVDKYQEGQVVTGLVTKLVTFGAFARIEGPVEGLIHVSELVDRRIGHPKEVVREGDLLPLKVVRIERERHRLGLSLRRARDEGEAMGYVFSDGAEVISVPDEIRAEFEAREGPIPEPREEEPEAPTAVATEEPAVVAATDVAEDVATEAQAEEAPTAEVAMEEAPAEEAPTAEVASEEAQAEEAPTAEVASEDATAAAATEVAEDVATEAPAEEAPTAEVASEEEPEAAATEVAEDVATEAQAEEAPTAEVASEDEPAAAEAEVAEDVATEAPAEEAPTAEVASEDATAAAATEVAEDVATEAQAEEAPTAEVASEDEPATAEAEVAEDVATEAQAEEGPTAEVASEEEPEAAADEISSAEGEEEEPTPS